MSTDDRIITKRVYKPLDFFMIRTPLLPINSYDNIFNNNLDEESIIKELIKISKDPIIRESIAVASLDLLNSLDKLETCTNKKEKNQIISSLLKYFIRMTTRTTPFGEFSGVTLGKFSEKTDIELESIHNFVKRARPDMEWIYKLINILEKDKEILNNLMIYWNSIVSFVGSRVEIPYLSIYTQENSEDIDDGDTASIRASKVVKYVWKNTKRGIKYIDLVNLLKKEYEGVNEEKIEKLLKQLLSKEVLITNLRPPLDIISPYEYILNKIEDMKVSKKYIYKLKKIDNLIREYNTLPIGEGEKKYINIVNEMKNIVNSKNYLQVDLKLKTRNTFLNKNIANELSKTSEIMCKISSIRDETQNMVDYRNDFIARYGEEREIPILELINSDKGIGFPSSYNMHSAKKLYHEKESDNNYKKIVQKSLYKIFRAVKNKEKSVVIDYDEIKEIEIKEATFKNMPTSFEIYALIRSKSKEDIDKGNYKLFIGPCIGSDSAGKTFGRFTDILDNEIYEKFDYINRIEKGHLSSNKVFAQLVFAPNKGAVGNICLTSNIRDYEIVISTASSIHESKLININDLVVGVNKGGLYLRSRLLNKEVIVTTNNMFNRKMMPNICRFLLDISDCRKIPWFSAGSLFNFTDQFPYVPRIEIGKVVISPQSWRLSEITLGIKLKNINEEEFLKSIFSWKAEWNVPKYVYQVEADNRLMFNLENKVHIKELLNILKKKKNIMIQAVECDFDNCFVYNEKGKYVSEIVVPIIKNNIKISSNKFNFNIKESNIDTLDSRRTFFPGSEWLFLKLYGNYSRENELIGFELNEITKELMDENLIQQFFFMRYKDTYNHIRLRFKGNPEILYGKVLRKLNNWFDRLKENGLLTKVEIGTYEREIERYGGIQLIDYAEKVFFYDSQVVSNILYLKGIHELDMDYEQIAICSIISYLEDFNIPYMNQIELLNMVTNQSEYREGFKKKREQYTFIGNSNNNFENLRKTQEGRMLYSILQKRTSAVKEYALKIEEESKNGNLANSKLGIYLSILHLHCNRLFGINREKEKEVISYARHTLYALKFLKTKKDK
ncbi:lantibiotic dehydratase [Clostridium felsineum]|uniref:lantibiotic dehydratase n=1 Tax=Clostridium felsineum TaxID=36839 RepID=UPI00214DA562|nr:lantibiotic dehydratase [Clostridium felsineum]MCR3761350.1 lantibiotic dehydratase [Clostridium felsineum]